ncbi:SRPBCC domain-containing protein [Tenacibaculum xiamenense]|uniref:SRPBCC domain-containing protein n=1 Tax=Tenacibaculum xiamenense TaxID=1261553 RepID=UPI00389606B3
MKLKTFKNIEIETEIKKVWNVLTLSKYTKEYMFNCTVESEWKKGSPITWQGNYQGYEAFQKGIVLEFIPYSKIKYSTFDPNFGLEDIPDNYIHVTYELVEKNDKIQLTITNETFDGNKERMNHINQGWEMVIQKLKEVAEKS